MRCEGCFAVILFINYYFEIPWVSVYCWRHCRLLQDVEAPVHTTEGIKWHTVMVLSLTWSAMNWSKLFFLGKLEYRTKSSQKKPNSSTFVNWREATLSLKFGYRSSIWKRLFSDKSLSICLYGSFLSQLLHFRCHIIIISSGFMNETVRAIVNGFLLHLNHWYQNSLASFKVLLLWAKGAGQQLWGRYDINFFSVSLGGGFDNGEYQSYPKTSTYCTPSHWFSCVRIYLLESSKIVPILSLPFGSLLLPCSFS